MSFLGLGRGACTPCDCPLISSSAPRPLIFLGAAFAPSPSLLTLDLIFLGVCLLFFLAGCLTTFFITSYSQSKRKVDHGDLLSRKVEGISLLRNSEAHRKELFTNEASIQSLEMIQPHLDDELTPFENVQALIGSILTHSDLADFDRSVLLHTIHVLKLDPNEAMLPWGLISGHGSGEELEPYRNWARNKWEDMNWADDVDRYLVSTYSNLGSRQHKDLRLKTLATGIKFVVRLKGFQKNGDTRGGSFCPFAVSEYEESEIDLALQDVEQLHWDVFNLELATAGRPLQMLGWHILQKMDLIDEFHIDVDKLKNWLEYVEAGYHKENPYHNATHATDILQTVYYFLTTGGAQAYVSRIEVLAILLAAMAHDLGHDGKTNDFHKATLSERAMEFNDQSVQENYHASRLFMAMKSNPWMDIFSDMTQQQSNLLRASMIEMILQTDMSKHFHLLESFKFQLEGNGTNVEAWASNKAILLDTLLHAADISNQTKPFETASQWTDRVLEEFFAQGDEEARIGVPISQLCDRNTDIPKSQIGFIKFIVLPTFNALGRLLPVVQAETQGTLRENLYKWNMSSRPVTQRHAIKRMYSGFSRQSARGFENNRVSTALDLKTLGSVGSQTSSQSTSNGGRGLNKARANSSVTLPELLAATQSLNNNQKPLESKDTGDIRRALSDVHLKPPKDWNITL